MQSSRQYAGVCSHQAAPFTGTAEVGHQKQCLAGVSINADANGHQPIYMAAMHHSMHIDNKSGRLCLHCAKGDLLLTHIWRCHVKLPLCCCCVCCLALFVHYHVCHTISDSASFIRWRFLDHALSSHGCSQSNSSISILLATLKAFLACLASVNTVISIPRTCKPVHESGPKQA